MSARTEQATRCFFSGQQKERAAPDISQNKSKQKTTQMIRNAAGLVRRGKLGAAVGPKELVKGLANILKTAY